MFTYIKAGAGCGKTTFIINKIKNIIKNTDKKILLITYTNSCVEEIINRCKMESISLNNISISTLHSLCNIYNKNNKIFLESNSLDIISQYLNIELQDEFYDFYNYLLNHSPIQSDDYLLELKKNFPYDKTDYIPNNLNDFLTTNYEFRKIPPVHIKNQEEWVKELNLVINHFNYLNYKYNKYFFDIFIKIEETRKILNLYTYHHMILDTLDNIENFTFEIINNYDEIFIDEVQDMSHIYFEIIENITEELIYYPSKNITIVGDVNQSIYGFQGANENNFINFINNIKSINNINYEEITLNETYRFGGEIIKLINNKFYNHISNISCGNVEINNLISNKKHLLNTIKNKVIHIINNYPNESIMILFQKRTSFINQLENYMDENLLINININRKLSFNNEVLCNFFDFINFLINKDSKVFLRFLLGGMIQIPEPDFYNFIQSLNNDFTNLHTKIIKNFYFLSYIKELESIILFTENNKNVYDFLIKFNETSLSHSYYNFYGKDAVIFIKNLELMAKNLNLIDLIYLNNKVFWFYEKGNVIFSTIHNSKGKEADHVIIVDGNDSFEYNKIFLINNYPIYKFFPNNKLFNENKEWKNLLYVSLTRSKRSLYIFGEGTTVKKNSLYDFIK